MPLFRRLVEAASLGRDCGSCPDLASYNLLFALHLRKITENLRVAERRSAAAPNAIRVVDLAIVGDVLD